MTLQQVCSTPGNVEKIVIFDKGSLVQVCEVLIDTDMIFLELVTVLSTLYTVNTPSGTPHPDNVLYLKKVLLPNIIDFTQFKNT